MLRSVCIRGAYRYMHSGSYISPCSSRAEIPYKYKLHAKCQCCFQTKMSCSFKWCYCFCSECNIIYRKLFTETVFAFNLHFQHIGLNLQENQVHHSKECKILVQKRHLDIKFTLYLVNCKIPYVNCASKYFVVYKLMS